jgi:indole-3-glycerol phosphate synthase
MSKTIMDRIVAARAARYQALIEAEEDRETVLRPGRPRGLGCFGIGKFGIIAEVKNGSPSLGRLRDPISFERRLTAYESGGAAAVSVVTEPDFFFGELALLDAARELTRLPVLRKDFVIHPVMVREAYDHGADWVLLIAAILPGEKLECLVRACRRLGLTPLVEVHDAHDLDRVLPLEPELIGINNRDLRDFSVSLDRGIDLFGRIPPRIPVIAESGIRCRQDIDRLRQAGFAGALVGEHLMRQPDPDRILMDWLS